MDYQFEKHRIIGGIGADDEYWRGLERGEFRLSQCAKCGKWTWPAHFRCGNCGSWEMNWVALAAEGRVYSWTRSWYVFDRIRERAADVPYVTILAEIPAADCIRVMGVMKGDETGLRVGAAVVGTIDPPMEKTKYYPSIRWALAP